MSPDLSTQLPAHVDNALLALKGRRVTHKRTTAWISPTPAPRTQKYGHSLIRHSVALMLAALNAVLVAPWSSSLGQLFVLPFYFLFFGFLMGFSYTFWAYTGPRMLLCLELLQVPSALWIWLVGGMAITGDVF